MTQAATLEPRSDLLQGRTIGRLWLTAVSENRATPAYLVERDGAWQEVRWAEAAQIVDELAHGLLSLGVRKGDAFATLGQTTLEWAMFDFALALIGAVGAPIYANSSARDAQYVVAHSEAIGVLCEDEEQRAKVEPLALAHTLTFADLDDLRARGRAHAKEHPDAVLESRVTRRRGRPLHVHLHVRHDRPAEGLHDPPPQLLRDGRGRRPARPA